MKHRKSKQIWFRSCIQAPPRADLTGCETASEPEVLKNKERKYAWNFDSYVIH
jgi:hypothetical protein